MVTTAILPAMSLLNGDSHATRTSCQGRTKAGKACPWRSEPGELFCTHHHPQREEERRAAYAQRGRAGARKKAQNRVVAAAHAALSSATAIREALERALAQVESSGGDATSKAHAVARICSVALDSLRTLELERQVEELRALVEARTGKYVS